MDSIFGSVLCKSQNQYEAKAYAISQMGKVKWCNPETVLSSTATG